MKYNINLEYKYKRKVWINMSDTAEILRLRVLLAFLQLERDEYVKNARRRTLCNKQNN